VRVRYAIYSTWRLRESTDLISYCIVTSQRLNDEIITLTNAIILRTMLDDGQLATFNFKAIYNVPLASCRHLPHAQGHLTRSFKALDLHA